MVAKRAPSRFFREHDLEECRKHKSNRRPEPHQEKALRQLHKWYAARSGKDDGGILVLPTGGGKTFTAVHFLCRGPLTDGFKVLWLAHTHHLLEQAFKDFEPGTLGTIGEPRSILSLRVVSGTEGHFPPRDIKPTDDVVIATLQTITNAHREELAQFSDFVAAAHGKLFVVFDEAHHSPAPSYRKLLLDLRAKGAPALGLTATPTYSDESKRGWLKKIFPQGILAQARVGDLIAQEILAQPVFERPRTSITPKFDEPDYQKWLGTYGDIPEDIISHLAKNRERNELIAQTYANERVRYGKTIVFADRWYQCDHIVAALEKRGVKADAVYSYVDGQPGSVEARARRDKSENAVVLERFRKNEIDVLVNVKMLTEGTDIPDAQTVFLTRQTTSRILLTQMVGRALRGPKFGGTAKAYIVSFIDDWHQPIAWAEWDQLREGEVGEVVRGLSKRVPVRLISIELVRRLVREMESGATLTLGPLITLLPAGWYRVVFDARVPGTDEIEANDQLVMVFDDEREGFDQLINALTTTSTAGFDSEDVSFEEQKAKLEELRTNHLEAAARPPTELLPDIFHVARHIGQGHGRPEFFLFQVREQHDLDAMARDFVDGDLGPRAIHEALEAEYVREDRFWRSLFYLFDEFRRYYDACQRDVLKDRAGVPPEGKSEEHPSTSEPDEEVKRQVKRRDGNYCLACGSTKRLCIDHVEARYRGGRNDMGNLQTLCRACNSQKDTRTMRFTVNQTALASPPRELEVFDVPDSSNAGDRAHWDRFLQQTINFTYQCSAISKVEIGGRGHGYYNWTVDLAQGNHPAWIKPFLAGLVQRIQVAREEGGKPPIASLTITAPGEKDASWR